MSNLTPKELVSTTLTTIAALQQQLSTLQAALTVATEKFEVGDSATVTNVSAISATLNIYLTVTEQTTTTIQSLMHI